MITSKKILLWPSRKWIPRNTNYILIRKNIRALYLHAWYWNTPRFHSAQYIKFYYSCFLSIEPKVNHRKYSVIYSTSISKHKSQMKKKHRIYIVIFKA